MKKWDQKCKDDSETANWLNANTKDCIAYPSPCGLVGSLSSSSPCTLAGPKCHTAIEKNGGCNHMVLPVRTRCVISSPSHSLLTFRSRLAGALAASTSFGAAPSLSDGIIHTYHLPPAGSLMRMWCNLLVVLTAGSAWGTGSTTRPATATRRARHRKKYDDTHLPSFSFA